MRKNPIKTRQYFVARLIKGEWVESPFPTSTLKDAEEIAKHMLGKNGVKQTRIVSYNSDDELRIHRNYSHEGFVKNPVRKQNPKTHKNYFVTYVAGKIRSYYDGIRFTGNKSNAAIFHSVDQAKKVAEMMANKNKIPVKVEFE